MKNKIKTGGRVLRTGDYDVGNPTWTHRRVFHPDEDTGEEAWSGKARQMVWLDGDANAVSLPIVAGTLQEAA